jgi:hypothetical protein
MHTNKAWKISGDCSTLMTMHINYKLLLEKLDDSKLQAWSPQFGGHAQRNVEICT